ncbi:beta-lactamase/transpeptidase-like protein [Lentinus tigrinus ALCF2SS1-7]|uniref:Beta-lactamase/transpeptidase-like protein n=1 Tax=Lentinus tigrinus ALCF2SS1-6 TaxID=1328759 RepID=A0A5C2SKD7_9APHY|nr:beta-lactamase/transpeptidase-like protein [Lentinus tigrinus ALCF2SS1-6]RPD76401.1 beta-lactamase/transpeptidase-like protein [Lentinus tigrinus ALCF2SS1-7]
MPVASPEFGGFIEEVMKNGSIPGISVGVVRLGEDKKPIVQLGSWGRKTEDGNGHDLSPDSLFGLASCSKAFLATSIGILMDDFAQGRNVTPLPAAVARFEYETKVKDLLPEQLGWGLHDISGDTWATEKARIKDILGHVAGLPRHDYAYAPGDTPEAIIHRMRSLRTGYELREQWSYNNQMFMLGAHLVSQYTNGSYVDFVVGRIFKPLGMSSTTFWPSEAQRSGKLTERWTKDGRLIPFWFDDEMTLLKAGPGGIISSAEDMVKWLSVWLNKGVDPVSGETIFPEEVYDAVTTAHWISSGRPKPNEGIVGYGMGWFVGNHGGINTVYHGGAIPGYSILTGFAPQDNLGISILANADEKATYLEAIIKRILSDTLSANVSAPLHTTSTSPERRDTQRATDARSPSLSMHAYTGTYRSPGYNPISLCSSLSPSSDCEDVLADFATLDSPSAANHSLYSAFKSIWASHVRLQHFSGDVFNITFTALFPHGFGKNTSAFETAESGTSDGWVEFVMDGEQVKGFALFNDQDAVEARKRHAGVRKAIPGTADAWFAKI